MIKSKYISTILELLLDDGIDGIKAKSQIKFLTDIEYDYTGSGVFVMFKHELGIKNPISESEKIVLGGVIIESTEPELRAGCNSFL